MSPTLTIPNPSLLHTSRTIPRNLGLWINPDHDADNHATYQHLSSVDFGQRLPEKVWPNKETTAAQNLWRSVLMARKANAIFSESRELITQALGFAPKLRPQHSVIEHDGQRLQYDRVEFRSPSDGFTTWNYSAYVQAVLVKAFDNLPDQLIADHGNFRRLLFKHLHGYHRFQKAPWHMLSRRDRQREATGYFMAVFEAMLWLMARNAVNLRIPPTRVKAIQQLGLSVLQYCIDKAADYRS